MWVAAVIFFSVEILMFAGMWSTLRKANLPGWGALVPAYNLYLFVRASGLSGVWFLYCLIPVFNIYAIIKIYARFGARFGMGIAFSLGLLLLPFVFFPVLGFGSARYCGMD